MLQKLSNFMMKEKKSKIYQQLMLNELKRPIWMGREFRKFVDEGYIKNVVAYRSITMIATSAASIDWQIFSKSRHGKTEIFDHPLLNLLQKPNPIMAGAEFFENIYAYKLISGNAYIQAVGPDGSAPMELHYLRPDRVSIIAGDNCLPNGYRYKIEENIHDFPVNKITGKSLILHLKHFHPSDDWYGLSPIEAAAFSIDLHNNSLEWNQSLLQNGARPSGAMIVTGVNEGSKNLSEEQFYRLKNQMDEQFAGAANAGRPMLLEGGIDWKEMSLSPKDMDFIEAKNSAARDIALAFGVPPQLLGIKGDNSYNNMFEARLMFIEQTVLPMVDHVVDALNNWLSPMFGDDIVIGYNKDTIPALEEKKDKLWDKIKGADFLSNDEKRKMLGIE